MDNSKRDREREREIALAWQKESELTWLRHRFLYQARLGSVQETVLYCYRYSAMSYYEKLGNDVSDIAFYARRCDSECLAIEAVPKHFSGCCHACGKECVKPSFGNPGHFMDTRSGPLMVCESDECWWSMEVEFKHSKRVSTTAIVFSNVLFCLMRRMMLRRSLQRWREAKRLTAVLMTVPEMDCIPEHVKARIARFTLDC